MGRVTAVALGVLVGLAAGFPVAAKPAPFGASKDLGFSFRARGGEAWCRREVIIELRSTRNAEINLADVDTILTLGRIRGVVTADAECPAARELTFVQVKDRSEIILGETSALGRWVVVKFDGGVGNLAECFTPDTARDQCDRYAAAYRFAKRHLHAADAAVTFGKFLDTTSNHYIDWAGPDGQGFISVIEIPELLRGRITAASVIEPMLQRKTEICRSDRGAGTATRLLEVGTIFVASRFDCAIAGPARSESVLVKVEKPYVFVLVATDAGAPQKGQPLSERLIELIGKE